MSKQDALPRKDESETIRLSGPVDHKESSTAHIANKLHGVALRNYVLHGLEGGLFMGGMAFLAGDTVLPALIRTLGGPNWLIALIPSMMWLGATVPSIFTAHLYDRLSVYKPTIILTGIFQRIVFVFAGLALILIPVSYSAIILAIVALTPFISGVAGGITLGAWQAFTIKVIPENKRASLWAIRFIIGSLIGILAGSVVKIVLEKWPGIFGFGLLHLIESVFLAMSMFFFILINEKPHQPHPDNHGRNILDNFRDIPGLLGESGPIRNYIISGMISTGLMVMTPFLVIRILDITGKGNSFLGTLITAQMLGGLAGNAIAGYLGDRYGGKLPTLLGRLLFLVLAVSALFCKDAITGTAVFFLFGFSAPLANVGATTLSFDICPEKRRITYLSVMALFSMPALLAASAVSTVLKEISAAFWPLAAVAGISQIVSIHYLLKIPEPRKKRKAATGSICCVECQCQKVPHT
jgi:MFS family permease